MGEGWASNKNVVRREDQQPRTATIISVSLDLRFVCLDSLLSYSQAREFGPRLHSQVLLNAFWLETPQYDLDLHKMRDNSGNWG